MKRLISFCLSLLALIFTAWLVPGIEVVTLGAGVWAALILALVNTFLKPILTIFTLPLTILTFGFFLLVINGLMLSLTASLVGGFRVANIWAAIFGSLVLTLVNSLMNESMDL